MEPIHSLEEIERIEKTIEEQHVIILLLLQPSDSTAGEYIRRFNYWKYLSGKYCSIYLMGYSKDFREKYSDVVCISQSDGKNIQYSDQCFINVCEQLSERLKNWNYSGEPELFVLQKNPNPDAKNPLDFSNYNYIDMNYGIEKGYIDSIPRFIQRLIISSKKEVEAGKAIARSEILRITPRKVLESAISDCPKIPNSVKEIMKDALFFKTSRTK